MIFAGSASELRRPAVLLGLGALVMLPRFGVHTPDTAKYLEVVEGFRAGVYTNLPEPFVFRPLIPAIAAAIPGSRPDLTMAFLSLSCTLVGLYATLRLNRKLLADVELLNTATLLSVANFCVANNGAVALTDGFGFAATAIAMLCLVEQRWGWLVATTCIGMTGRETLLLFVPIAWTLRLLDRRLPPWWVLVLLTTLPVGIAVAARAAFGSGAGAVWRPSLDQLRFNLTRLESTMAVLAALAPFVVLLVVGFVSDKQISLRVLAPWHRRTLVAGGGYSLRSSCSATSQPSRLIASSGLASSCLPHSQPLLWVSRACRRKYSAPSDGGSLEVQRAMCRLTGA